MDGVSETKASKSGRYISQNTKFLGTGVATGIG